MRKIIGAIALLVVIGGAYGSGQKSSTTVKTTADNTSKSPGRIAAEKGNDGARKAVADSTTDTDGDGILDLYDKHPNVPDNTSDDTSTDTAAVEQDPVAHVGSSLTLDGSDTSMKVKVVKVQDPVPVGAFDDPGANKRIVGVWVRMTNVGSSSYSDSPSNGATLLLSGDEQAESTLVSDGPCGSSFGSSAKIAVGSSRKGCIPFEVPASKKLKGFQFTLDSGFADMTGEWKLR